MPKDLVADSLQFISKMHSELPAELKAVQNLTGDPQADRTKFVASNILLTTQNLKMYFVGTEPPSMNLRCSIASELLDELSTVPLEFFRNLSTGSLHHLAQVGQMLGDAIKPPISAWRYLEVRNILLILVDFLEKIESTRISTANLSASLRSRMGEIDRSMQESSKRTQVPGLLSMGWSLLLGLSDQNGVGNENQLNPADSPSQYLNLNRQMPRSFSPSVSQLTRLLEMADPTSDNAPPPLSQSGPLPTEPIPVSQTEVPSSLCDIPQPAALPAPSNDLFFSLTQSNAIPTDIFDGWQAMLK
ncbi:hypothetical protein BO78DRAFT_424079 [Aspergillus sclerotiicarbonarius CBS 121057]|uniref:Uncharacterized protein n=1 Tax=Aspergillus sclerotiicarbonarius (strain CBS 121057 / IBT 28362) TaxID=1448318 RepID=A0A319F6K0_ASPSB|nr:hypothetical protein BO78DRAFT_424079 [Aspergillus sclerotiicarbonarius CBS 121057]